VTSFRELFELYNTDLFGDWIKMYTGPVIGSSCLYYDMGWNFGDIVIGLFSFILTRYFKRINRALADASSKTLSLERMEELRHDHQQICNLVQVIEHISVIIN